MANLLATSLPKITLTTENGAIICGPGGHTVISTDSYCNFVGTSWSTRCFQFNGTCFKQTCELINSKSLQSPIVCATSCVKLGDAVNLSQFNGTGTRLKICGTGDNSMYIGPNNDDSWGYIVSTNNSAGIYFGLNQGNFQFDTGSLGSYTDAEVDVGYASHRFRCGRFSCVVRSDTCICSPIVCATSSIKTYGSGRQDIWVGSTDNNAGIWLDGSNGDFSGSDYAWIRHNNDKSFEITLDASAGGLFNINNQSNTDMNFRTNGALRFVIEAGGNTRSCYKHFACTCLQSPIVCGTNYVKGVNVYGTSFVCSAGTLCADTCIQTPIVCASNYIKIGASGSYICQAGSGDLEIKSAGGDLDIVTWLRMRAGTNSTIKSSWSHSTGHMHIGGDTSNSAQDYAMKVSVVGSAGSICGAGCIRSASHIVSGTCLTAPVVCATSQVISSIVKQPADTNYLTVCGGCTNSGGIVHKDTNGTIRGYTYWDGSSNFGLLSCLGSWAVRIIGNTEMMLCKPTCAIGAFNGSTTICATTCLCSPIVCGTSCVKATTLCGTSHLISGHCLQVGNHVICCVSGSNYIEFSDWIRFKSGKGVYSSDNGAHFYPNNTSDYGSWQINGTRNAWNGLRMCMMTVMARDDEAGLFNDTDNEWILRAARNAETCIAFNGQWELKTYSGGLCSRGYLQTGSWVNGTQLCLSGTTGDNASPKGEIAKHVRWNYTPSSCWRYCPTGNNSQNSPDSLAFSAVAECNRTCYGIDPFGRRSLIWHSYQNDTASDADGGWVKAICNLDPKRSYLNVVYFKKLVAGNNSGTFYHGTGSGSNDIRNIDGSANGNPYFMASGITNFDEGQWYVSIGYIVGCDDTSASYHGGVYRLCDGCKHSATTTFRMGSSTCHSTGHRVYLYYSDGGNEVVQWWGPGHYEINGMEPSYGELLNGHPSAHNKSSGVDNQLKIPIVCAPTCVKSTCICATSNMLFEGTLYAVGGAGGHWDTNRLCAATCVVTPVVFPTSCLMFDQSGTRSWKICAGSGRLDILSGDDAGSVYFQDRVTVNGTGDNSGKSDFTVHTGGVAALALSGGEVRMGAADVNWSTAVRRDGHFETYGQNLTIQTQASGNIFLNPVGGVNCAYGCLQSPIVCASTRVNTAYVCINGQGEVRPFSTDGLRGIQLRSGCTSTVGGIEVTNNAGTWLSTFYVSGTNYGHLDASWGGWDIKKTVNGSMCIWTGSSGFFCNMEGAIFAATCLSAPTVCATSCLHTSGKVCATGDGSYFRQTTFFPGTVNYRAINVCKWATGWNAGTGEAVWGLEWAYQVGTARRAQLFYDHNSTEEFVMQSNYGPIVFNASQNGNLNPNAATERMRIHSVNNCVVTAGAHIACTCVYTPTVCATAQVSVAGRIICAEGNGRRIRLLGTGDNCMAFGPYDDNGWGYVMSVNNANGMYFEANQGRFAFDTAHLSSYNDGEVDVGITNNRFRCANFSCNIYGKYLHSETYVYAGSCMCSAILCATGSMKAPVVCGTTCVKTDHLCLTEDYSGDMANGIALGRNNGIPQASWGESGATTGRIEIGLPTQNGEGGGNHYGMVHVVVDVYEYNSNNATTIIVGGHNWGVRWYNCGAHVMGGCTDKTIKVAYHACGGSGCNGRYVILLGEPGSTWSYGSVHVRRINNGKYYLGAMDMLTPMYLKRVTCADSYYNCTSPDLRASSKSYAATQCATSVARSADWVCGNRICSAACVLAAGCVHGNIVCGTQSIKGDALCIASTAQISGASDTEGLAIGQAYSNEGGWDSQLNMYGGSHAIFRIKKASGSTADNAQCLSMYVHNNNPAHIVSTGNLKINAAGATKVCFTSAQTCITGPLNITTIGCANTCLKSPIVCATSYARVNDCMLYDQNHGAGAYGLYSSTKYQHVWSMGTAYKQNINGSDLGNLYGLSYTHTNVGGQSKAGLSHQLLFVQNGTATSAVGLGMWTCGVSCSTNCFEAPVLCATNCLKVTGGGCFSGRPSFVANNTNNWDTIASANGSQGAFEVYNNGSGNDAFFAFHAGGDYATYFGLDADTNRIATGGWSAGAYKYPLVCEVSNSIILSGKFCSGSSFFCSNCACIQGTIKSANCICAAQHVIAGCCMVANDEILAAGTITGMNKVCAQNGFYGDGSNITGISSGGGFTVAGASTFVCPCGSCTNFCAGIICATTCFSLSSGSNVTKMCNSVGFTTFDSTEGVLVRDNSANVFSARASGNCSLVNFKACCNVYVCGSLSKASGCFSIPHPDPAKNSTHNLQHSFVESPTEGDNIYRWQVETNNCSNVITLPSYYKYLNKNDMVWVSPYKNFGAAYGEVTADQCCLIICSNQDGCYNVLLIGTRKDEHAENMWSGPEVLKPENEDSPTEVPAPVHWSQL